MSNSLPVRVTFVSLQITLLVALSIEIVLNCNKLFSLSEGDMFNLYRLVRALIRASSSFKLKGLVR